MTPKDYEYLLVAADLVHFQKRWGFSINIMKWKLFLEGHRFTTIKCDGTFEVDTKKLDLNAFIEGTPKINSERLYFLWIGILKASRGGGKPLNSIALAIVWGCVFFVMGSRICVESTVSMVQRSGDKTTSLLPNIRRKVG